jgi:hypothetical protein
MHSAAGFTIFLFSWNREEEHTTCHTILEFLIRRQNGITARLFANNESSKSTVPALVEAPYSSHINTLELAITSSGVVFIVALFWDLNRDPCKDLRCVRDLRECAKPRRAH